MPYLPINTILGKLETIEVYEYYDIPRLFTCLNQYGYYYMALSVSDTDLHHIWIYALVSKKRLKEIRVGEVDLHDVFKETEDRCVFKVTTLSNEPDTAIRVMCKDLTDEWLPIKGPKLRIPKSRSIPKGSHQIIGTPSLPGMEDAVESYEDIIKRAFSDARVCVSETGIKVTSKGWYGLSSDRVIADTVLDKIFIDRCYNYGLRDNPTNLNLKLMAMRKASKLSDLPKSKTNGLRPGVNDQISFAAELALRLVRLRKGATLDQILCDPDLVKEFDELARNMSPGFTDLEYRLSALNVRKRGTFKKVDDSVEFISTENISKLRLDRIPESAGLYLFSSNDLPVFINQTDNLRNRLGLHLANSDNRGLPDWLWSKKLQHSYVPLPTETATFRKNLEQTQMRQKQTFLNFYSKTG